MSQKRKSNQELDNCQFMIILEREKDQLLAEAKSEILRHENKADLAENNTCDLKRQIDCQAVEIGHTRRGMHSPDENKFYITKNWQIENEHIVILVLEVFTSWKNWREQEFRLEEFSIRKLVENHI